jgi:hypothetical protein
LIEETHQHKCDERGIQLPEAPQVRISPARRVAFAGIVAALSCVLLYIEYLIPLLRFSLLFILSLLPVTLAHERRYADALLAFVASALLSGLLFPAADTWILYAAFFGWYGVVREFVLGKTRAVWRWVILAAVFNAAFLALFFLASYLFANVKILNLRISPVFVIPVAEAAFAAFEILFGVCRNYYVSHVRKSLFRRG